MIYKVEKQLAILGYASALLLYINLLLFIMVFVGIILYNAGKNHLFASFHLRQMTGIALIAVLVNAFANAVPNGFIAFMLVTFMVVIAILGLFSALRGQKEPLPYIGIYFQQFFSFIK